MYHRPVSRTTLHIRVEKFVISRITYSSSYFVEVIIPRQLKSGGKPIGYRASPIVLHVLHPIVIYKFTESSIQESSCSHMKHSIFHEILLNALL